jgi:hypothetical protein
LSVTDVTIVEEPEEKVAVVVGVDFDMAGLELLVFIIILGGYSPSMHFQQRPIRLPW